MNLDSSKVPGSDCISVVVLKNCELSYILAKPFLYVSEGFLFSRLLEDLVGSPYI